MEKCETDKSVCRTPLFCKVQSAPLRNKWETTPRRGANSLPKQNYLCLLKCTIAQLNAVKSYTSGNVAVYFPS